MLLFTYKNLNSQMARTLSKNVKKETLFFKKQVIFLFVVVFCLMIYGYQFKKILLTHFTTLFSFFLHLSFNFRFKFNVKLLLRNIE